MPSPGVFARTESAMTTFGLSRKRIKLPTGGRGSRNTVCGGVWNSMVTSVTVLASDLPERTRNGTPSQRHESTNMRSAA